MKKQAKNKKKVFKLSIFKIAPEIKQIIVSFIMFLIAAIIVLSFFGQAGIIGKVFQRITENLIGNSVFFIPLFFILLGLIALKSSLKKHLSALILGMLFFVKGFSAIFYALKNGEIAGGSIGSFIFINLEKIFDVWASWLIVLFLVLIGILIIYKDLKSDKGLCLLKRDKSCPLLKLIKKINQFFKKFFSLFLSKKKPSLDDEKEKKEIIDIGNDDIIETEQEEKISETIKKSQINILQDRNEKGIGPISLFAKEQQTDLSTDSFDFNLFEIDIQKPVAQDIDKNLDIIKQTLKSFSIPVQMKEVNIGPTVTQYTLQPSQGIKLSKIASLSNDLALALSSLAVIIEAPIPGRNLIGIQIPNKDRAIVRMRPLLESLLTENKSSSPLTIILGRDVVGNILFLDLKKMPHLLVAGMTGSGKTVCLNSVVLSLLINNSPNQLRMILMDFKRVEFIAYNNIPHLIGEVVCNIHQANKTLDWLIKEMEDRFYLLQKMQVKDIVSYNKKALKQKLEILPYIVLVIDELADLIMTKGKEVESKIVRLCQMSRAAGIHLVLSTQRPSVEVITGLIKANIAARIALTVASHIDSRTILDLSGAERLLGNGDMLYITPHLLKPKRAQGVYLSEEEIKKATNFLKNIKTYKQSFLFDDKTEKEDYLTESLLKMLEQEEEKEKIGSYISKQQDSLYSEAVSLVIRSKKASASLLQRHLRIGYARAARLIDMLEQEGIVGPGQGAKPRKVFGRERDNEEQ